MRFLSIDLVCFFLVFQVLRYNTPAVAIATGSGPGLTSTIRSRGPIVRDSSPERRDGAARFTYYDTGLGACGQYNQPSDFIVALNAQQWDGGSHCFQMITISYGSKSTQAQIVDRCEGCPVNALDLSEGLFTYFVSTSAGVIYGDWSYSNGAPPVSSSTAKSAATTTDQATVPSPSSSVPATASSPLHNLQDLQVALVELGGLITAGANLAIQLEG